MPAIPYFLLAAALVAVDQVVKFLVRANIPLHTFRDLIPGFDLTFVQNTGAAFSILRDHTWLLTLLSAVVSLVIALSLAKNVLGSRLGQFTLALMLGGAVGNLIDRALLGYVTDMFATTFMNFPVFNVADMAIVAGGVLLCLQVIFLMKEEEKEEEEKP